MKKVLILAYDFPPYVSVAGLRPYAWYQHFKNFDIEPIVVTRQWGNKYKNHLDYIAPSETRRTIVEKTKFGTIIKTPYQPNLANKIMLKYGNKRFKLLRKSISFLFEITQFFLPLGTKYNLYKEAKDYLKKEKVDVILATGEPFVLFHYANKLSKQFNVPWIADYRDPWSQNKIIRRNKVFEKWNVFLEKKITNTALFITTVSKYFENKIQENVKPEISFYIIANGFDDEALFNTKNINQESKVLSFTFAGTIYPWHPIESVLNQFSLFVSRGAKIKITFYGINKKELLMGLISSKFQNLKNVVKIVPKLSNEKLIRELLPHNVLLLFNDYSIIGTKIYNYIAVKRKILFCYKNDENSQLLKQKYYSFDDLNTENNFPQEKAIIETQSGVIVENSEHLAQVLNDLYAEFEVTGEIKCDTINPEEFSRKSQTKKLAEIIHLSI